MVSSSIDRVAIYPGIGIARVGNSPDAFFFGPETIGEARIDDTNYRDAQGRIKRQAARFRIYGLNAAGEVVKEITAADGEIAWSVHVANHKAGWFNFDQALDIPASRGDIAGIRPFASLRRNQKVQGADRAQLMIDPGPRSIEGVNTNHDGDDARYAFDTGRFFGKPVYLGELRTDEAGRLLFLGGRGTSASHDHQPPQGFANNDGWHDDISDGPVTATVKLNGREFKATGAWVITAPPDFAPGVQAIVTGWDLLRDVACAQDPSLRPARPSFWDDIHPLLRRFADTEWVNAGFAREFGWGSPQDFRDPAMVARLADPSPANEALRRAVFGNFRRPDFAAMQADAWPAVYGDGVAVDPPIVDPRTWMAVTVLQHALLRQWADGEFAHVPTPPARKAWGSMSAAEQVRDIDRAVLDETTGGPFHPGAEFTWPMRIASMYAAPFRLRARTEPEGDFGTELTSSSALAPNGPLDGCVPGSITRWMACPWQTDTASCLSAYRPFSGEYLPTFWPARVPNDVLSEADYAVVMDSSKPTEERLRAFSVEQRAKWLRGIVYKPGAYPPVVITQPNPRAVFIEAWTHIGIVAERPGPKDLPLWPATMRVETGRSIHPPGENAAVQVEALWTHDPSRQR